MKTLVAVRIKETKETEIFEFKTKKDAMSFFHEAIKKYGDEIDIAHTVGKVPEPLRVVKP